MDGGNTRQRVVTLIFFIAALFHSSYAASFNQGPANWFDIGASGETLFLEATYVDEPPYSTTHGDAFDAWGAIRIDGLPQQWTSYSIDYNSASYAVVSGPGQGASGLTVNVILRLTDRGWAVGLTEMTNPTGSPISVSITNSIFFSTISNWNIGSDGSTQVYDSFTGNPSISAADSWFTTWDGSVTGDPMITTSFGPYMDSLSESSSFFYFSDAVTIPAGATSSFMWVTRISDPHQRATQIPYISNIIDDINQLYAYGLLDHLTPAQISNVYNFNTFLGGGGGDPHILGMDGSTFDIIAPHGDSMDDTVVNLFSDHSVQLNAKIGSPLIRKNLFYFHTMALTLLSNREQSIKLLVDASIRPEQIIQMGVESNQTLSPPHISLHQPHSSSSGMDLEAGFDEVFGEYRIQVVDRDIEKFFGGDFAIPSISRFDNSNAILKIAVTPSSAERDAYKHQHSFLFVVHQEQHKITPSTNAQVDWVKYGSTLIPAEIHEEQQGESGMVYHRRVDVYVRSPGHSEPHGYIGQSHPGRKQYRREWERWEPLEGEHSDYVLQSGDVFGSDFHFNRFHRN